MKSVSFKEWQKISYPRALLSIIASVGGLALFLLLASTLLVSQPIGSTIRGYFYGVSSSRNLDFPPVSESGQILQPFVEGGKSSLVVSADHQSEGNDGSNVDESGEGDGRGSVIERAKNEPLDSGPVESESLKDELPHPEVQKSDNNTTLMHNSLVEGSESVSSSTEPIELAETVDSSPVTTNSTQPNVAEAGTALLSKYFTISDFLYSLCSFFIFFWSLLSCLIQR